MLLLLLLVVKPILTLEQKKAIPTNPTSMRKDPIANFAPPPTFSPLFFTTLHPNSRSFSGLHRQRKKKPEKREKGNILPTFLLTTQPTPRQHQTFTSLTYRGVSRPLVELLRKQLQQTPPVSSSFAPLNMTTSNAPSCSFLSGSLLPLSGTCTGSGACRVGRTDYQAAACSSTPTSSVGNPCVVSRPLKRTKGTCSSEGHCIGRYE